MEQVKYYRDRHSALVTERSSWLTLWMELSRFISPHSSRFLTTDRNRGDKKLQEIIDITGCTALRSFKSGMMAGTASASRPWFRLAISDPALQENKGVKMWLFAVERIMRDQIARSNYYKTVPIKYAHLGAFGTAAFLILEDTETVFRCYPLPVGSYCLSQNSKGKVDTISREFEMTAKQLVEEFGIDNISTAAKTAYETCAKDKWFKVIHFIGPNQKRDPYRMDNVNKPFIECYIEQGCDEERFLRQSGYDEFPAVCPRWETNGEDAYGTNHPGMIALGPIKGLQVEQKDKLMAIHKMVDPPLILDTMMQNQSVDSLPGGINFGNIANGGGGRPLYEVQPRVNELMMDIQEVQRSINRAFFVDIMEMFMNGDTPQMNNPEVEQRAQERMWAIGPVMEAMNDESFNPTIDRFFNIMLRRGMFPEPPTEIQGQELKVEYISIMAQAQKAMGVGSIERTIAFIGNLAATNPQVLDKLDMDQSIDEYAEMVGAPPSTIRSDKEVQEIREGRAQQEQMAKMASMAQPLQQTAQAAKLLSETDDGTGRNPLATVLGLN